VIRAEGGPIEERLLLRLAWFQRNVTWRELTYVNLVNLRRRDITRIHQAS